MFDKIIAHTSFIGETGYANHSRNFFTALNKLIPVKVRNFTVGSTWTGLNNGEPHNDEWYLTDEHKEMLYKQTCMDNGDRKDYFIYGGNEEVERGNNLHIVLNEANHYYFYDKYDGPKIAYNVWESTLYPEDFFNKLLEFDQLWVPTTWQKECSVNQGYSSDKIKVIPEAVDGSIFFPEEFSNKNCLDDYMDNRFKFLLFGRWDYRKSTKEIINTFLKTFDKDEPVDLIVSIDNPFSPDGIKTTEERLSYYGFEDSRIKIKHFPSRENYVKYLKTGHVFLSCARSEGWNLPLIESLACGTPSIYSNWGAQLEFSKGKGTPVGILGERLVSEGNSYDKMVYNGIPGNFCEPDYGHLSKVMRDTYENYEQYKSVAIKDSEKIRSEFTWESMAEKALFPIEEFHKGSSNNTISVDGIEISIGDFIRVEFNKEGRYLVAFYDLYTSFDMYHEDVRGKMVVTLEDPLDGKDVLIIICKEDGSFFDFKYKDGNLSRINTEKSDLISMVKSPVIVSGCPGGGTSFIFKMLRNCGLYGGTDCGDISIRKNHESKTFSSLMTSFRHMITKESGEILEFHDENDMAFLKEQVDKNLDIYSDKIKEDLKMKFDNFWGDQNKESIWGWKLPKNSMFCNLWQRIFPYAKFLYIDKEHKEDKNSMTIEGDWFYNKSSLGIRDQYINPKMNGSPDVFTLFFDRAVSDYSYFNNLLEWIGLPKIKSRDEFVNLLKKSGYEGRVNDKEESLADNIVDKYFSIDNDEAPNKIGTYKQILNDLLSKGRGVNIVETGCSTSILSGGGTIVFADFVSQVGGKIKTIDISESHIDQCKNFTSEFKDHIEYVCGDSVSVLSNMSDEEISKVDLFFLDSFDLNIKNPDPSMNHHLKEVKSFFDRISDDAIIAVDDNYIGGDWWIDWNFTCDNWETYETEKIDIKEDVGKGILVRDFLLNNGWNIVSEVDILQNNIFVFKKYKDIELEFVEQEDDAGRNRPKVLFYPKVAFDHKKLDVVVKDYTNEIASYRTSFVIDCEQENSMCYWAYLHSRVEEVEGLVVEIWDGDNLLLKQKHRYDNDRYYHKFDHQIQYDPSDYPWATYHEVFIGEDYKYKNCRIEEGDVCLDVGANYGFFSLYAKSKGASKVYAVEPVKTTFSYLLKNVGHDLDIIPINKGISNKNDTVMINCSEVLSHASLYDNILGWKEETHGEEIEIAEINSFLEENSISHIDFFKADIEGEEYNMIEAWDEDFLRNKVKKIAMEVHTNGDVKTIISKLNRCGFFCEYTQKYIKSDIMLYAWKEYKYPSDEDDEMEIYQDYYVNGKTVRKGVRECDSRYECMKEVFSQYSRPFTILDIGANFGYYSLRACTEFGAYSVMVESEHYECEKLIELSTMNDCRDRLIIFKKRISLDDLRELSKCEHFDVVLGMNVLHHFEDEDVLEACELFTKLGDNLILETPPSGDKGACGKRNLDVINNFFNSKKKDILGSFDRHTCDEQSHIYWIKTPKSELTSTYFEYDTLKWNGSVDAELVHLLEKDPFVVESSFSDKKFINNSKGVDRKWIHGINMETYLSMNGVYPDRKLLSDKVLKRNMLTDYTWDNSDQDICAHNIIMSGSELSLIDYDDNAIGYNGGREDSDKAQIEIISNNLLGINPLDKDNFVFLTGADKNYEPLLIECLNQLSFNVPDGQLFAYGFGCDFKEIYSNSRSIPILNFKKIGNLQNNDFYFTKIQACIDAIDNIDSDYYVWIDADSFITENIMRVVDYFDRIEDYPLSMIYKDWTLLHWRDIDGERKTKRYGEEAASIYGIERGDSDFIVGVGLFVFNKRCKKFFEEILRVGEDIREKSGDKIFVDDNAFSEERVFNILMWKYGYKGHLPITWSSKGDGSTLDYFKLKNRVVRESIAKDYDIMYFYDESVGAYDYSPSDSDVIFFHSKSSSKRPDEVKELTNRYNLEYRKEDVVDKIMFVAHPDDEAIFAGNTLLKESLWRVISVTGGDDPVRRQEFENSMGMIGINEFEIWDFEDSLFKGFGEDVLDRIRKEIESREYSKIVTHNPDGEYGHIQHKSLYDIVFKIAPIEKLYVFDFKDKLTDDEREHKEKLLKVYKSQVTDEKKQIPCLDSYKPYIYRENIIYYLDYVKSKDVGYALSSFDIIWEKIKNNTLLGYDKSKSVYLNLLKCKNLKGDLAEVGCYKGGTVKMMSLLFPDKKIYVFDTFEGMTSSLDYDEIDGHAAGDFSDFSMDDIKEYLKDHANVIYKKGVFPQTADGLDSMFSLVHIDGDLYSTTRDSIAYFKDKMVYDGVMIFDDYGWHACSGVEKAVNEVFEKDRIIQDVTNQCYIVNNGIKEKYFICLDSKSLGDNLAWMPYAEEYRKKHNCEVVVSTFWNNLFEKEYPEIEFMGRGKVVHNINKQYNIGWYAPWDPNKNPNDFRTIPLQQTASDILGLDYKEIKPKIAIPDNSRNIKGKYICIGMHSTCQSKYWNYPNGWQEVVDYLNEKGYKVVHISKERGTYMGNIPPNGIIDKTGEISIEDRIVDIKYADMFIGIGSGLSWLSWAVGTPTILISGFSKSFCEPTEGIERLFVDSVCNGCFNDPNIQFDPGDWNWCPRDKDFECSRSITPEMVIRSINKIIDGK